MARQRKPKMKCPGQARPIEYAVPAYRQVRHPRTGELHVLLNTGRQLREHACCELAYFTRPGGFKVAVQRCRDRKLTESSRCRAGGDDWAEKVRENFRQGMTVKGGAFAPGRLVQCPPTHARERPPRLGPRVQHCFGYDVRVAGERVASTLDKDQAQRVARRLQDERGEPAWVSTACRASDLIWKA